MKRLLMVGVAAAIGAACGEEQPVAQSPTCEVGTKGCPCYPDKTCGQATGDNKLVCDLGRCVEYPCRAGDLGCACLPDGSCNALGAECRGENLCLPRQCSEGEQYCPCVGGTLCNEGLVCRDSFCVDATGFVGGRCLANNTCYGGNRCKDGVCEHCNIGSEGCGCFSNGACNAGLACVGGTCVKEPSAVASVPSVRPCYSPCAQGFNRPDGTYVACPVIGLAAGCFGGLECVDGSCVKPPEQPPTCKSDVDCPDFQACIQGKCYSNCEYTSDCQNGLVCHRYVCRLPCTATSPACPDTQACVTVDGSNGFCMPLRQPTATPAREVKGSLRVAPSALDFSNVRVTGSFELLNDSPTPADFKVKKVRHVEYTSTGPKEETALPLYWLRIGTGANLQQAAEITVRVDPYAAVAVQVGGAFNSTIPRWDGALEVSHPELGVRTVNLSYVQRPDGQWTGKMYYFTNFPDQGLNDWVSGGRNANNVTQVRNAFIQQWGDFKRGLRTYEDFQAMLAATENESWKWDAVKQKCREGIQAQPREVCYLADNAVGVASYTQDVLLNPIPTGVTELPIALNVQTESAQVLVGKLVTSQALQYGGDPAVRLQFTTPPDTAAPCHGTCLTYLADLSATIALGGRHLVSPETTTCPGGSNYTRVGIPWLIPGFQEGTAIDPQNGLRYRYECRDNTLPFGAAKPDKNLSLAAANPIPDGRARLRTLSLVDGALINNSSLFIVFKESYPSFLGVGQGTDFAAYGYMVLSRGQADLKPDDYAGASPTVGTQPQSLLGVGCSADILQKVLGSTAPPTTRAQAAALANAVVSGTPADVGGAPLTASSEEQVHYYCEDTGLFDGGKLDPAYKVTCPVGSRVVYFTVRGLTQAQIAALPCQEGYREEVRDVGGKPVTTILSRGSCWDTLQEWKTREKQSPGSGYSLRLDPVYVCNTEGVYCDSDRLDLRQGKTFYARAGAQPLFVNLEAAVNSAFRYKTRFRSRSGGNVGFAPSLCVPDSDQIPYCYDPAAIEEIRKRVDCATWLLSDQSSLLDPQPRDLLKAYLTTNFSFKEVYDPALDATVTHDGFERLFAELAIMMGDESYTRASASRFDLAGANIRAFEGALFEPDGINLSGGAGFEMFNLYQAVQYYQMVLDRFYALSPLIWKNIGQVDQLKFITAATATTYFPRLIRASTQKARAYSEIARRYQNFNRPDLARHVIERAYTSTYLESIALARFMLAVVDRLSRADAPQVVKEIEAATLGYRSAMLDMRDRYKSISDERTLFGFAPDYIPFPALDPGDTNAFEKLLGSVREKMAVAAQKESEALASNRAYETDAAMFQSELVRVRDNFENQLAEICGTFKGDDGRVYPAIPKYAYLNERTRVLQNPCGLVGNGAIHTALANLELAGEDAKGVSITWDNLLAEIQIEFERAQRQCSAIRSLADFQWESQGKVNDLQTASRVMGFTVQKARRAWETTKEVAQLTAGATVGLSATPFTGLAIGMTIAAAAAFEGVVAGVEIAQMGIEAEIASIQRGAAYRQTIAQCDTVRIDADARMRTLALRLKELENEAYKADLRVRLAASEIQKLQNQATRLMAQQTETEQLTINVEAARNDPNVRIYKNDSILTADRTFERAVREAYRLTKVYEYYTSQSYERLGDLFLVRMISHGDITLERYVSDLEDAFFEFEEQYGNPDLRVAIVSLRDDVLQIPRLAPSGAPLSHADRVAMLRQRLADPKLLDENGYLSLKFSTAILQTSPLTRNHKINFVEAEIIGSDVGDTLGRVYLRQRGTGVVRSVTDVKRYYAFPARTAVLNPFFNGVRVFTPEVYRNERLRDRPYANTHWELVLNQRDEMVNQDINLNSLTDIRLYVYYTDFTAL